MQILLSTPSVLHHQSGCTQCNISNTASMEIAHLTHHRLIKYQYAPKVALWHQQSSPCFLYPPGNPSMQFCLKLKSSDRRTVWVIPTTPPPTNIADNPCRHYPKSLLPYIGVNRQSRGEKREYGSNRYCNQVSMSLYPLIDLCHYEKRLYALCYILRLPASQSPQQKISSKKTFSQKQFYQSTTANLYMLCNISHLSPSSRLPRTSVYRYGCHPAKPQSHIFLSEQGQYFFSSGNCIKKVPFENEK